MFSPFGNSRVQENHHSFKNKRQLFFKTIVVLGTLHNSLLRVIFRIYRNRLFIAEN